MTELERMRLIKFMQEWQATGEAPKMTPTTRSAITAIQRHLMTVDAIEAARQVLERSYQNEY